MTNEKSWIRREVKALFELKKSDRLWHIPLLASVCTGVPLFVGLYFNNIKFGTVASLSGLVILYLSATSLADRMITLLACSFGFMISFTIGICFSFSPYISAFVFGLYAFAVHWVVTYFRLKPPGSFFFILIASIASCTPFNLQTIPERVGLIGLGAMFACTLAFIYSLIPINNYPSEKKALDTPEKTPKHRYTNSIESAIIGVFSCSSLLIAHFLNLQNPYWVPISCIAVLQGVTLRHVWQRSFQRILGTFIGLGLCWLLLSINTNLLSICISICILQFIIEVLVVRHYALAVIFITPMTILLAEAGTSILDNPSVLIITRFQDIFLGSIIGALGGYFLHHEQLRQKADRQLRKTRVAIKRR